MKILKMIIAPVIALALIGGMVFTYMTRGEYVATMADKPDGLLYADFFTDDTVRYEWKLGLSETTTIPKVKNDSLYFSGTAPIPSAALLQYELPEAFELSYTADIARRGGNSRSPSVIFNVGETLGERYQLWMDEGSIKLTYNADVTILSKKVEELKGGGAYAFRLAVKGNNLKVYFDGSDEPLVDYTASGDYESFAEARTFGVLCYCYEFYLDNLLITDGKNRIPAEELKITGQDKANTVTGIGREYQMMVYFNPSNVTDSALIWSVSDKTVAKINQDGLLTAKNSGTVTVTAKTRDGSKLTASCDITVKADEAGAAGSSNAAAGNSKCLADDYVTVFESTSPQDTYVYSPALCVLPSGRIIATCDLGGEGVSKYIPVGYDKPQLWTSIGRVAYSDDGGQTWKYPFDGAFMFGQPFYSGNDVYIVARNGEDNSNLIIYKSTDSGETWSKKTVLDKRSWHSAPTEALYVGEYIYMTMEVSSAAAVSKGSAGVNCLAPIMMRAKAGTDLTDVKNWAFSEEMAFADVISDVFSEVSLDYFGIPYRTHSSNNSYGWLEGNVFQIYDERHEWYDPTMKTFYVYLRAGTLRAGYAAAMKVVENEDGTMRPSIIAAPSGRSHVFIPMPGGTNKFGITYDKETKTYWLVSSYNEDSMTRQQHLSGDHMTDQNNERQKLALYFSKNAVDWGFAGMVAMGDEEYQARSYAYITIVDKDILILSRSGDENACSAHDTNLATLHRVKDFRGLMY